MPGPDTAIPVYPLTTERWDDFVALFGPNGASQGCWCMFWRLPNREFNAQTNQTNRAQMKDLVDSGVEPGLLAYVDGQPAGWIALAPRSDYRRLAHSRVLKPVDDAPVWSLPCFYIKPGYRRKGLASVLLQAAIDYARQHGATLLEAYPKEPQGRHISSSDIYTGVVSIFEQAGFQEVARHTSTRPILRLELNDE